MGKIAVQAPQAPDRAPQAADHCTLVQDQESQGGGVSRERAVSRHGVSRNGVPQGRDGFRERVAHLEDLARAANASGRLGVRLCGIDIDNPVIPASGTFGYGYEFADIFDINVLGSFSFKGTTSEVRFGNEQHRIAECSAGMINSVGLQNPGVEAVLERELPLLAKAGYSKVVMANVSGFSIDEYVRVSQALDAEPQVGWIELNVSCPNVHGGGLTFGQDPRAAEQVVSAVKAVVRKPLIVKLSPNVTDIAAIARACAQAGADGLSLINTLLAERIDLRSRKPVIARRDGGFSGPAVFPVAVRMVDTVCRAVDIPVAGIGGVSCARDVVEMMMAGASAVQVGTANLVDPLASLRIVAQLPTVMDELGIDALADVIGAAL
ncbi:MAG: dihydroorotate dehydrogenase [Actinomycetaceae bacterium]|nr:dihydroorotate dehydrogenase [Actinomycetaceae bacterium]MDY5853957.1 dihydroorotate dehydrogenase [Arcanobacterium sp.]